MCGGMLFLDDEKIKAAQRLLRDKPEPLLASVRSVLGLPPHDPVDIVSNALAEGTGIAAMNALRAATLLHLHASPGDTHLSPIAMLERVSAPPAAPAA